MGSLSKACPPLVVASMKHALLLYMLLLVYCVCLSLSSAAAFSCVCCCCCYTFSKKDCSDVTLYRLHHDVPPRRHGPLTKKKARTSVQQLQREKASAAHSLERPRRHLEHLKTFALLRGSDLQPSNPFSPQVTHLQWSSHHTTDDDRGKRSTHPTKNQIHAHFMIYLIYTCR